MQRSFSASVLLCLFGIVPRSSGIAVYEDRAAPIPARVADLISRMTPVELAHQLINKNEGGFANLPSILADFGATGIGTLFIDEVMNKSSWGSSNVSEWSTPLEALRSRNALQAAFLARSRLRIPASFCMEGLHSGGWGGTIFPALPVLAQSFNASLVRLIGGVIAVEARATGVDTALSPVVNMFSDPRFGRYSEGFSPDPHVSAALGAAMVLGLQGDDSPDGPASYLPSANASVVAQAKHAVAYGHAAGGQNGGVADVTNRTLHEVYLKPWRAMAAAGLRSLMVSHQTVNDIPCHANGWLINGVLRDAYGFGDGFTISDEMNIGHLGPWGWAVADNISHAAALALRAGVDIDLQSGASNATQAYAWLSAALAEGLVSLADLQAAASRVLTLKFATGLFDAPMADEAGLAGLNSPAHQQLALEAARQGIVLAKNDGNLLPLRPSAAAPLRAALIGPFLDCAFSEAPRGAAAGAAAGAALPTMPRGRLGDPTPHFCMAREALLGPYAQDNGQFHVPLLPEALAAMAAPGLSLTVSQGANISAINASLIDAAVAAAAAADVAILLLGDSLGTCDEGTDRSTLDLTPGQLALLLAIAGNSSSGGGGTPIILVLLNGRPTTFGPSLNAVLEQRVGALLIANKPGQRGSQAIAEILLGVTNPSGKLADSWARAVGHIGSAAQPFQQLVNGEWASNPRAPRDVDGRVYQAYYDDDYALATPLFPFGFGLSYTTMVYESISAVQVTPRAALPPVIAGRAALRAAAATTVVRVSVRVCNAGGVAGDEVVAVYSRDPRGGSGGGGARAVVPHIKRLVGFARVTLAPATCALVLIDVTADHLAQHATDYAGAQLTLSVLPGVYTFSTGPHSRADALNATLAIA